MNTSSGISPVPPVTSTDRENTPNPPSDGGGGGDSFTRTSNFVGIREYRAARRARRPKKRAARGRPPVWRCKSSGSWEGSLPKALWEAWNADGSMLVEPGRVVMCRISELAMIRRCARVRGNALGGMVEPGYPTMYMNMTISKGPFKKSKCTEGKGKWDAVAESLCLDGWDPDTPALAAICRDTPVLIDSHHRVGISMMIPGIVGYYAPVSFEYFRCNFSSRRAFLSERRRILGLYLAGERRLS